MVGLVGESTTVSGATSHLYVSQVTLLLRFLAAKVWVAVAKAAVLLAA